MTVITPGSESATLNPTPRIVFGILKVSAERRAFRKAWQRYTQEKAVPSSLDMALFCLILGKPLARAFTPVSSALKLANGQCAYGSAVRACQALSRLTQPYNAAALEQKLRLLELSAQIGAELGALARAVTLSTIEAQSSAARNA